MGCRALFRTIFAAAGFFALLAAAPVLTAYPATAIVTVTDTSFGTTLGDPYRWLENDADAKVQTWAGKQSKLTLAYLHAQPSYAFYAARVAALAKASTAGFGSRLYDLLRTELTPNGAYNTAEFGEVKGPAQFAWMRAQSPYERVVRGRAYPAVLITTGENDRRVSPYESRKLIARLQASSSSQLPILLWQKAGQGHGIGNSFAQRVADQVASYTWFESQLR